jgi:hypothetical protein
MSKADAKRSAVEARKLISLMMTQTDPSEVEDIANEIVALVIAASEARIEVLDAIA